jgi:hypothetical protein
MPCFSPIGDEKLFTETHSHYRCHFARSRKICSPVCMKVSIWLIVTNCLKHDGESVNRSQMENSCNGRNRFLCVSLGSSTVHLRDSLGS